MPRLQAPPEWGIQPVPADQRSLRGIDIFVLWSSLGVGLLVLEAGALLVPGMSPLQALAAIVLGTAIGNLLLALTGVAGSDHGIPTMVLLRPVLGRRGSYIATALNVAQLIGWTAFELWVIGLAANQVSQALFGFSSYGLWLTLFAVWCTLLALGGPLIVVRQWLEKFGVWLVYGVSAWMTVYLFTHYDISALLRQTGTGELPFWLGVDLVVAMPISWMPLVADYNRFVRRPRAAFWGTYLGYLVANVWFYGLGALFILTANVAEPTPEHLITAIMAMTGGIVALLVILVDETDNAFADIYSTAVSIQNVFPQIGQRALVLLTGAVGLVLAAFLTMSQYFNFLLLIGSFFVPLFGVMLADYFVIRRRQIHHDELYGDTTTSAAGIQLTGLLVWAVGVVVYHAITRLAPQIGASVPSFLITFILYSALKLAQGRSGATH
ncbi:MAG: putative hydroxymethylpyrimidine transporter CytX [Anaerolineae bacterium]